MPETLSPERDRAALLQCRAGLADTHARLALLDLVVSGASPELAYAPAVGRAREHLEAALVDLELRARLPRADAGHWRVGVCASSYRR